MHPSKMEKYAKMGGGGNLTLGGRETGVRRLMTTNLLKRLESSVCSFRLTLERVLAAMNAALIAGFRATCPASAPTTPASGKGPASGGAGSLRL